MEPKTLIPVSTWNLGGAELDKIPAAYRQVSPEGRSGLLILQELPRTAVGWHTEEKDGMLFVYFQDESVWRGVGVAFEAKTRATVGRCGCGCGGKGMGWNSGWELHT